MDHIESFYLERSNRSNALIPPDGAQAASKIVFKNSRKQKSKHGAIAALNEVAEQSLSVSPSHEILSVKQALRNQEIDEAVAKSFQVSNAA